MRASLVFSALLLFPAVTPAADAPLRTFLDTYCVSCHDAKAAEKGQIDLVKLSADLKEPAAFASWVKVHDRIRAGEMPPKDRQKRPSAAESAAFLKNLGADLTNAELARRGGDGRAIYRRLNRTEYENTLRDLFGLQGLKVKDMLPEDGIAFGYDKSAVGLDLSYVQMTKYMEAADVVLDAAIAPHAARPALAKSHIPGGGIHALAAHAFYGQTVFLKDFKYDNSIMPVPQERMNPNLNAEAKKLKQKLQKDPYPGTMGLLLPDGAEFKPTFPFVAVYPGRYRIRMSVWSFLWDKGEVKPSPRTEAAALLADGRALAYFDAPSLKPTVTEVEVWLNAMNGPRDHIGFTAASLWALHPGPNLTKYVGPGIALDWLEVEGPLVDQWPPLSHRRLFGDLPLVAISGLPKKKPKKGQETDVDVRVPQRPPVNAFIHGRGHEKPYITNLSSLPRTIEYSTVASKDPEADARRLLADFLPRAFRRPVAAEEVERYVGLVKQRLADDDAFEVAMRTAYKAALCSPDFLFIKQSPGQLDHWAVASRLSYFLWNSMPDDELFALAEKGKLHDAAALRGQVERMLKDPKAERFVVDFTDQWLDLKDMDETTPDKKLYPEFRMILHDAMPAETRAFFRELLDKDLSASNVVHSDFAMLNQRLAEHYRIPGVTGSAIRRVPLPADSGRGGFLTQAAVLKVTANGTVTSPVKRGAWIMNKIVGQPPDPPPPDVPAFEPDVRGTKNVRDMLAAHRTKPSCAACHKKIDPPGFALESFDVIGGRQTRYRSLSDEGDMVDKTETILGHRVRYTWGPKVDPSGELADGRAFADIDGLKKLVLADSRAIARNLAGQLTTYSTGAPVGFSDRAALEGVLDRTADSRYGIRSLIHEIVQSPLFLKK
jgi:hypothetical protein